MDNMWKKLIQLQEIDKEIGRLEKSRSRFPKQLREKKQKLENYKKNISETEDKIKKFRVQIKDKELSIKECENTIDSKKGQIHRIKSNQEYKILLDKIKECESEKENFETQVLEMFDQEEKYLQDKKKHEKQMEELEKEYKKDVEKIRSIVKEIDEKLSNKKEKRKDAYFKAKCENGEVIKIYDKLYSLNKEEIIIEIDGDACGACYIQLLPRQIAKLKDGKFISCQGCMRFLYMKKKDNEE